MSDSSEESYESSGQQPVFDIDQLSVDSDNQKAIEYLQKVRQEAQMAPKCTYFEEGQDFQAKQTDAKYLVTPRGVKLNGKWAMNPLWQKDVVEQYVKFKENIEQFRKLDSNSYLLQNVDEQVEKEISKSIVSKVLFREIAKTISPTLLSISKLDYTQSTNIIKWLCNTQRYNYHQSLWIYGALTQLEDPLDADVMGNMNRVLQNCYNIECGTSSVLITIIQLIFNKNMLTEFSSFFDNLELVPKLKHIWSPFQLKQYENDPIVFESVCHKISRKSKQLKQIILQVGQETLYLFKDKSPKGMLQLTVTIMQLMKSTNHGMVIRVQRNGQYIDIVTDEWSTLKQILTQKCLQTTFHEEFGVTKMIGKGSFAKVYLAAKKSTGVQYAVKAFNKEYMLEQFKGKESLENEIRVMRRLNQQNLVHLHEAYETQNSIYFVLDLLQGGELLTRAKQTPLNGDTLQKLMYNFLKALAHIHSKKCVHRDLKPENLLLKTKESHHEIVIADFGLAAFLNEEILFKRCGTPGFVAPEILMYKEEDPFYDEKCDIFSAGVIFYILVTGKQPFTGSDYKAILKANKNCDVNYNVKQIQQSSNKLQELMKRMMQPNPKDRPSAEQCLKHSYFTEIYNESDLVENRENLISYEVEFKHGLQKKGSFESQGGSMELVSRSPVMNGRIDTVGSLSVCSGQGSVTMMEKQPTTQQQSKFSQFCQQMKSVQQQDTQQTNNLGSPANRKPKDQDLHKFALKNSYQKKQMSKDDDYVNEEAADLDGAIQKLNSQTPKIGMFKKSSSFKVPKTTQE